MIHGVGVLVAIGLVIFLAWLLAGSARGRGSDSENDQTFDASDSRQVAFLIGLTGGQIADAAIAKYALTRFEEIHGRKATARDLGIVIGLSKSLPPG